MNAKLFSLFLLYLNIPLAASDHAGYSFRAMFPDSKITIGLCNKKNLCSSMYYWSDKEEKVYLLLGMPFPLTVVALIRNLYKIQGSCGP